MKLDKDENIWTILLRTFFDKVIFCAGRIHFPRRKNKQIKTQKFSTQKCCFNVNDDNDDDDNDTMEQFLSWTQNTAFWTRYLRYYWVDRL